VTGSADDEWHYPPGQYEAGLIHHLVRAGRAAVISVQFAVEVITTRPGEVA
jgi:hypothetical protein